MISVLQIGSPLGVVLGYYLTVLVKATLKVNYNLQLIIYLYIIIFLVDIFIYYTGWDNSGCLHSFNIPSKYILFS
jgi:hypothetical protein